MATFTVNSAADVVDGNLSQLSLREAVNLANATVAADTIVFAGALDGQTLILSGGVLTLSQDTVIDGDANNDGIKVILDGNRNDDRSAGNSHILATGESTDVRVLDLALVNGRGGYGTPGGSIGTYRANLEVENCEFTDNFSSSDGGAIFASDGARITVINSIFTNNEAFYSSGGAIATSHYDVQTELVIRGSSFLDNYAFQGGGAIYSRGTLIVEDSLIDGNRAYYSGGGIRASGEDTLVQRTAIINNGGRNGGGLYLISAAAIVDSTISANRAWGDYGSSGGGILTRGEHLVLRNSTITGNSAQGSDYYSATGAGVARRNALTIFDFSNVIIVGNELSGSLTEGPDVFGQVNLSNGHNIFGSDVLGNIPGDRELIAASSVFANIDPDTGGGQLSGRVVPLLNSVNNPALSGADPLAASTTGQNGTSARPQPTGSLADIGSIEINQPLSTTASSRNDVLTGTGSANSINAQAGNDCVKGQGGNDTLRGGEGSDLLDGGTGNDKLYGDSGVDLVLYGGTTKVTVDLSLAADKATRGSETDSLFNIEGAVGSSAADTFKGNEFNNYFQGGLGKDTATGGSGRDLYDFNTTSDSKVGSTARDVITDFAHLVDDIDLMGLDANTAIAGNQSFRWVGTASLTGPGQVGYFTSSGNTIIRGSNDADAASEFEIQLNGIRTLSAADFYL